MMRRRTSLGRMLALSTLLACSGESADSGSSAAAGEDASGESGDEGGGESGGEGGEPDAIEISSFSVTQCKGDTGSTPSGEEALSASVTKGSIHVEHLDVSGNCCPTGWDMGLTVDGSDLNIWYNGDGDCDCTCLYDLRYEITGATTGSWTVHAGGASVEVEIP